MPQPFFCSVKKKIRMATHILERREQLRPVLKAAVDAKALKRGASREEVSRLHDELARGARVPAEEVDILNWKESWAPMEACCRPQGPRSTSGARALRRPCPCSAGGSSRARAAALSKCARPSLDSAGRRGAAARRPAWRSGPCTSGTCTPCSRRCW